MQLTTHAVNACSEQMQLMHAVNNTCS